MCRALRALLAVFAATLTACASAPKAPSSRQLAVNLELETVALVRLANSVGIPDDNGKLTMYCSGVFVSPTVILTAKHCVALLGMTPEQMIAHMLEMDEGVEPPNPVGATARFSTEDDYKRGRFWTGKVLAVGDDDLGAILVDAPMASPTYARIDLGDIYAGDKVEIVGHPGGYTWSYAEGLVSSVRMTEPDPHGRPQATIQAAIPVGHGDSGGGLFDASGNLIGIFSYVDSRVPGMGFCVHRDAVRAFLAKLPR